MPDGSSLRLCWLLVKGNTSVMLAMAKTASVTHCTDKPATGERCIKSNFACPTNVNYYFLITYSTTIIIIICIILTLGLLI